MHSEPQLLGSNRVAAAQLAGGVGGHVRIVEDVNQFRALRQEWTDLAQCSPRHSVFFSHEWFDSAWQWRRQSAHLYILCYYYDGKLSAVCPLVRLRRGGTRVLEFLSVPDTQLCDVIVRPEHCARAIESLVAELARQRGHWDVLRLHHLPSDATAISGLLAGLARYGFRTSDQATTLNPYVALDTSWEIYYASRSRSVKKAGNLATNRLRRAGNVVIEHLAAGAGCADDVDRFVSDAIAVSARSWKGGTKFSLACSGPKAFIRTLSEHAHRRGWLSVWLLQLDGKPIAMEYQLIADGNVYALRSDFDVGCKHLSPGSYLSRCLLERLFAKALRRYFMGPGENPYKYRLTEQAEPIHEGIAFSRTLEGMALANWSLDLKPALSRLLQRLKPTDRNDITARRMGGD